MDTKLKKYRKLSTVIITVVILLPAIFLTLLLPKLESETRSKKEYYDEMNRQNGFPQETWYVEEVFVHYAVESSFCIYSQMQEAAGEKMIDAVLKEYGWLDDHAYLLSQSSYIANIKGNANITEGSESLETENTIGLLHIEFDENGSPVNAYVENRVDNLIVNGLDSSIYTAIRDSIEQYRHNVRAYNTQYNDNIDVDQQIPKNFEITFTIESHCDVVYVHTENLYYYSVNTILWDIGFPVVIIAAAVFVMLAALLLPFLKKLYTGWEKPFCIPFEIAVICAGIAAAGSYTMFYVTGEICVWTAYPELEIIGVEITKEIQAGIIRAAYGLAWFVIFFLEYVVVSSVRQFLCSPKYYIKHRSLVIRFVSYCVKKIKQFATIDFSGNINRVILNMVAVYFGLTAVLSVVLGILSAWEGIMLLGLLWDGVTSGLLYFLLYRYGVKLQRQYLAVLDAANQMAAGNLKASVEEELNEFQPIGEALTQIRHGFETAVIEEAKSQNMKTELITNVSHDLKTPLTAIITYVNLLKNEEISEEERKMYIATLDQKSQRLKVLIEDLFEVSKAQSGNVTMNYMDVDVVSLLKQVRSEMNDQIEASTLSYRWNLPEDKEILLLDGQRMYRVFENLIGNTLKYSMPYSRVYVDMVSDKEKVQIIFRNTSEHELHYNAEQLTERFVRGDAARNSEGSGLGLAIAKSFVELQKGKFDIEIDGDLFKVILTWNK